ncbi:hypothetical protein GCM10011613_23850 [Cellvibrio zantedeschiae]|uniref:Glycosyltransferase RgtA/B/C/D-like domain-containing protein n=2 Tax=Cellvibrio zantedeschiae TaxID=1237077 RepID=A0ABQ3B4Q9_9GAMM|nr:hypothetical protein GCM10011613_23850 [Cellvibrio zantedeschiae]
MYLKGMFNFEQDSHFSRYLAYLEIFVLGSLFLLLLGQLTALLNVDVWRQDSIHYVTTYVDKLSEEGRWLNYVFFKLLKITPPALCVAVSYFCLGYFVYSASYRVIQNKRYCLALALLALNVPVLAVQLEWPDTLLLAFIFLAAATFESKKIPDYIFFPVFACLFFGSFSAFYFLLPLLYLDRITPKYFLRLCIIWMLSFVFGYLITNLIVYAYTGDFIRIASWRNPHPIHHFSDIFTNIKQANTYFMSHMAKYLAISKVGVLVIAVIYIVASCRSINAFLTIIVSLFCALAIYVSSIPVGIIVQERTTLTFWVAALFFGLVVKAYSQYYRFAGLLIILVLGFRMGEVSYTSIGSYANATHSLVNQIKLSVPYAEEEVDRVYIMVSIPEAQAVFKKLEKNIEYKNHFSESVSAPLAWISAFKYLGYKNIVLCVNDETGWCAEPVKHYRELESFEPGVHLFQSHRFGDDVIFTVNKALLSESDLR